MTKKYVIGVLVSQEYKDFLKIKETIFNAKKQLNGSVEICQITENNMYPQVKKFVNSIDILYTDVLRYDEEFNINSHDQNEYKFSKKYHPKYFHMRNSNFVSYCDGIFAFTTNTVNKKSAIYNILKLAVSKKINLKIFK